MSNAVGSTSIYGKTTAGYNAALACTNPTQATGTLTLSGNAVAGETVTVGNRVYTWAAVVNVQTSNLVLIGATASDSIDNLIAAINHDPAKDGTLYSFNTPINQFVSAAQGAGDTMVVTARSPQAVGSDGNQIPTSDTMSAGSWGSTVLTGGVASALVTTGTGSGGNIIAQPATYNVSAQGAVSVTSANTALVAASATPRKVDVINVGANGVWIVRGAAAAASTGYYLAQYGVLSVDEPTTDAFNAISPGGTQNVYYVARTAA